MFTAKQIILALPFRVKYEGNDQVIVDGVVSLDDSRQRALIWIRSNNKNASEIIRNTQASTIVCHSAVVVDQLSLKNKCIIKHDRPEIVFLRVLRFFNKPAVAGGIHPTAIVDPSAVIEKDVEIGPFSVIGKCQIGSGSIVGRNTTILDDVVIGKNVLVSDHCMIGGQGFGHIENEHGVLENMPHVGGVIISDNVEIFPFSNVDKGTLSATVIGKGTKIDHYCHIGHNSVIGEATVITARVILCGSAKVGNRVFIGAGAIIKESKKVGDYAIIGMGAVVTKDVPSRETWVGNPAVELQSFKISQEKLKGLASTHRNDL